jgi:hypothetical protein
MNDRRWLTLFFVVVVLLLVGLVRYAMSDTLVETSMRGVTICFGRSSSAPNPLVAEDAPIFVRANGITYDAQQGEVARPEIQLWPKLSKVAKRRVLRALNEGEGAFYTARGLPAPSPIPPPAGLEADPGEPE